MRARLDRIVCRSVPAGLAAAILLAAPRAARAEGEPTLLTLRPVFSTTLVVDDNPELDTDGGGDAAFGAWLRPRLEVGYHAPRYELGADLGVDVRRYAGYGAPSEEFANLRGWADVQVAPGTALRVSQDWVPQALQLGLPEDEGENLAQTHRSEASLRHWIALPGQRELEIGVLGTYFGSEDFAAVVSGGAVDQDFHANYGGGQGYVELQSPIAAGVTGFVRAQGGYRTLFEASDADHADLGGNLGIRIALPRSASLEIGGGGAWLHFAGLSDRPRALGSLRLLLPLPWGFVSTLGGGYLLSANLAGRRFEQADARVELERYLGRRTAATVAFLGTRFDDASLGSSDLFGAAEVRLRHQLTRFTQVVIGYRYWINRGDYTADDLTQNRATLELRFAPSLL